MKTLIAIIIAILMVSAFAIPSYAETKNVISPFGVVAVEDGEFVIITMQGHVYVGKEVNIEGPWMWMTGVRFPKGIGAVTFPAHQVSESFHKGPLPSDKKNQSIGSSH
jgi:hypothetical protein